MKQYRIISVTSLTFAISERYADTCEQAYDIARADIGETDSRGGHLFVAAHIHDWLGECYVPLDCLAPQMSPA